jgi:hypothetical protein
MQGEAIAARQQWLHPSLIVLPSSYVKKTITVIRVCLIFILNIIFLGYAWVNNENYFFVFFLETRA